MMGGFSNVRFAVCRERVAENQCDEIVVDSRRATPVGAGTMICPASLLSALPHESTHHYSLGLAVSLRLGCR